MVNVLTNIKMTSLDLNDLKRDWERACEHYDNRNLREGQLLFNMLSDKFPKIASSLVGTALDPFYSDKIVTPCLRHLAHLAGENDIRLAVFGKESLDERKEEEEKPLEMEILRYIQKRVAKENIPTIEGKMV